MMLDKRIKLFRPFSEDPSNVEPSNDYANQ